MGGADDRFISRRLTAGGDCMCRRRLSPNCCQNELRIKYLVKYPLVKYLAGGPREMGGADDRVARPSSLLYYSRA